MSILSLIGHTPLVRLTSLETACHLKARLYAKLEMFNPFGSVKDRTAYRLLKGLSLPHGSIIAEATSGNLGISLSVIGSLMDCSVHLFMPENMPMERMKLIREYGGTVHTTSSDAGMKGAMDALHAFKAEWPQAHLTCQFTNPLNPQAHFETTGPEIYRDLGDRIHCFVAGVGTGGTITGTAQYLKSRIPRIHITAVEPASSPVLSKGIGGKHRIYGIGAGFVPPLLDLSLPDLIHSVSDEDADIARRLLVKTEGILAGPSSGAALSAALYIGKEICSEGQNIVVLLPDSGERYLSAQP